MNPVHRAIERVSAYFADRDTRPAFVARGLLGMRRPEDEKLLHALVRERRSKQRSDGSVAGDLVATTWMVWELLDLEQKPDSPAVLKKSSADRANAA